MLGVDRQLWQCGGMMVDAPCSRVGHIYRKFAPFPNPGVGDFVGRVSVVCHKSMAKLVQDCGNSSALALELPQSCTNSSKHSVHYYN